MSYIWQNPEWPLLTVDKQKIESSLQKVIEEENKTRYAFSILKKDSFIQFKANMIVEEIATSLSIENEKVDIDSVFSSLAKRLAINNYTKGKPSSYSDDLVSMITDAFENKQDMSVDRLLYWQNMLFKNQGGLAKKTELGFRKGTEYVMKVSGKANFVVYEAIPYQEIEKQINDLLEYINKKTDNAYITAAVASLWFVLIHPFEDGNGRISRALADYILLRNTEEKFPFLCLSAGILKKRNEYYEIIESISSQNKTLDITNYVSWFIDVACDCLISSREQLSKTISISAFIGSLDPTEFNSRELKMLYLLASGSFKGKVTNEKWTKINKCSSTVAFRDIQHLLASNFLIPSGEGGSKTGYYFNEDVIR